MFVLWYLCVCCEEFKKVPDRRAVKITWIIEHLYAVVLVSTLAFIAVFIPSFSYSLLPINTPLICCSVPIHSFQCVWDCRKGICVFSITTHCWQDLSAGLIMVLNKDNWSLLAKKGKLAEVHNGNHSMMEISVCLCFTPLQHWKCSAVWGLGLGAQRSEAECGRGTCTHTHTHLVVSLSVLDAAVASAAGCTVLEVCQCLRE